ncbi:AsmA family protein [Nitrincola iocasae]|uniref:AsmA family protein n=1 Tax=Nitrincola iocasae TaxID=2614693 RepID=A0A5J6L8Y8_9GAMM|nr:AsmA family protein [Nitrincola iocasae]QEW05119.1 AsmA family protein [Nitrincola iocasae]
MKRFVKIIAAALVVLVLVVAIGLFYITSVMDPNDYKPRIEQLALDKAGLELNIEGDIAWSLYPWLGMQTGAIHIAYPDKPQLASLTSAQVSLQLMPLFSGRVEMSDLILEGFALTLSKDTDGNVNWIEPSAEATEASAHSSAEAANPATTTADIDLNIESISVQQASIQYTDLAEDTRMELSNLTLTTANVRLDQPIPTELSFNLRLFEGADAVTEAKTELDTQLLISRDLKRFNLTDSQINLQLGGSGLPPNLPAISLRSDINLNLLEEHLTIDQLSLTLGSLALQVQLSLQNFNEPDISGRIEAAPFNLKALLAELGQPPLTTQNSSALEQVGFSTQLTGDLKAISLSPLSLTLDDTQLTGSAGVNLQSGQLSLALKGNTLNADHYLPPQTAATSASGSNNTNSPTTTGWSQEEILPIDSLKAINLSLELDLEALIFEQQHINNPGISLTAAGGLINLNRLTAQLYSGQLNANGILDARTAPASTQANLQISDIQVGELLKEMADSEAVSGLFSTQAELTTRGGSIHAMINNLNGSASLSMQEGVLQGINMAQTVCQGIQTVTSLGINTQQVDKSTPFADLLGNFRIRNGIVENNDLSANLDAMLLKGQGSVDLPAQAIDYRLGFTIQENLFQQTCSVNNRLEGLELPINCKGQFDTPPAQMCRPDTSVFTQMLRQEVQRKIEERIGGSIEEQVKERIGGEESAGDLIRGLLR